jgi:hypothetical protein
VDLESGLEDDESEENGDGESWAARSAAFAWIVQAVEVRVGRARIDMAPIKRTPAG